MSFKLYLLGLTASLKRVITPYTSHGLFSLALRLDCRHNSPHESRHSLPLAVPASRDKRDIREQFRHDHELIERLKISQPEMDSLAKCALLGTLTCKQDLLFILRQIREAGGPDQAAIVAQPPAFEEEEEDRVADFRRIARVAPIKPDAASLEGVFRGKLSAQLGTIFWGLVLVAGLIWNGLIAISRWHDSYLPVGTSAVQAAPSEAWYSHLDGSDFRCSGWNSYSSEAWQS